MKKTILSLISLAALVAACSNGTSDDLKGGGTNTDPKDPNATAGSEGQTYDHTNDPAGNANADYLPPEPAQIKVIGSPEVAARLHGCGKVTNAALGSFLTSRGLTGSGAGRPQGAQSGQQIYNASLAALGAANYSGRTPEAPFASTSAMSKMFDIFAMASYDAVSDNWTAPACPGVKLLDAGKFTKDGLSCLLGRPATDEHIALANDAITKGGADGSKIAVTTVLAAAFTCH